MSPNTNMNTNNEPLITLREFEVRLANQRDYFDSRLRELDLRLAQRFEAQEIASRNEITSTKEALSAALLSAKEATRAEMEATLTLTQRTTQLVDQKFETHNAIRPWVT